MTPFECGHRGRAFGWCLSLSLLCHVVVIVALALLRRAPAERVFTPPEVLTFTFGEPIRVRVVASEPLHDAPLEPFDAPVASAVPVVAPPLVRTTPPRVELTPPTPTLDTAGADHRPLLPPPVSPPLMASAPPAPTSDAASLPVPEPSEESVPSAAAPEAAADAAPAVSDAAPSGSTHHAALVRRPAPEYPRRSVRLQEEGTVVIAVTIDAAGAVTDVAVRTSSGHDRLDRAALRAARAARFAPARRDGVAIGAVVNLPFEFDLR